MIFETISKSRWNYCARYPATICCLLRRMPIADLAAMAAIEERACRLQQERSPWRCKAPKVDFKMAIHSSWLVRVYFDLSQYNPRHSTTQDICDILSICVRTSAANRQLPRWPSVETYVFVA